MKIAAPERVDVLSNGKICFSSSANLNDPFELKPIFQLYESDQRLEESLSALLPDQLEEELSRLPAGINRDHVRARLMSYLKTNMSSFAQDMRRKFEPTAQKALRTAFETRLGMLCLSETPDNLLMWAHYSASHTGFVLEFDTTHPFFNQRKSDKDELRHLRKVEYSRLRPVITPDSASGVSMFLTKSEHWSYEQEWRMFLPLEEASTVINSADKQFHLFDFPLESIKSVFLGCRMSADHRAKLLSAVREMQVDMVPECLQARDDDALFQLSFSVIDSQRT